MKVFRYLFRQTASNFFGIFITILLMFFSGKFVVFLSSAATGRYPVDSVLSILAYTLPSVIEVILPLSLCLAIILSIGQLYVDSEMIVFKSCGISDTALLFYVQGLAILVFIIIAVFSLLLTPLAAKKMIQLENDPHTFSSLGTLTAGSFNKIDKGAVMYVGDLSQDKKSLADIFIASINKQGDISLLRANQGSVDIVADGDRKLELEGGSLSNLSVFNDNARFLNFASATHFYRESSPAEQLSFEAIDAMTTGSLLLKQRYDHNQDYLAALVWRFSLPWLAPIAAIIALALSETSHRRGRYAKLFPSVLLFMLYFAAILLVKNGVANANIGIGVVVMVHVFFLLLGLCLYYRGALQQLITRWRET